ncbi:MAG: PKD domain-containing protein [Thermoplasmata archaeon]|nr:PKD domain-containing protein [Thermoplasmata archaeon]
MPIRTPGSSWAPQWLAVGVVLVVALFLIPSGSNAVGNPFAPSHLRPAPLSAAASSAIGCAAGTCPAIHPSRSHVLSGLTDWTNLTPSIPTSPPGREGASVVYDASDGYVLLFGGLAGTGTRHDTWKFANGTWTNLTPSLAVSPQGRYKAGMVYDAGDGYVLLFGGNGGNTYLNDTWKFHAGAWTKLSPARSPTPREDLSMADDLADGYVLMFGGEPPLPATPRPETWTFSAGVWTNLTGTIAVHPSGRETGAMTYDASDGYVLLFGGKHTANSILQDTWSYLGGVWTNLTSDVGTPPPLRESTSIAYDQVDSLVVLFGGLHFPKVYNDTWTYHNLSWVQLPISLAPSPRFDAPLAWTPGPGASQLLLFGGRTSPAANATLLGDTWSFKVPLTGNVSLAPQVIDVGQSTQITASASGGYSPYTVTWNGLPAGCAATTLTLSCSPTLPNSYSITATLNDSRGTMFTTAAAVLQVNAAPHVTATVSPSLGAIRSLFTFTSSVTSGTSPFTYNWSFGDSSTSSAANPTHAYSISGTYTAHLVVTDSVGITGSASTSMFTVNGSLTASASGTPSTNGPAPLTVDFDSAGSGGLGPYRFAWTFGDTIGTSTVAQTNYTYTHAGRFTATVTVTDQRGNIANAEVNVTVTAPLAAAIVWSVSTYYCDGSNGFAVVNATAQPTGGLAPYTYAWTIGDTGSAIGPYANETVTAGNSTNLSLTVTDGRGVVAQSNATATTTALPCATLSSKPTLIQNPLFWVVLATLLAVVLLEIVLLARRSRKK